MFSLTVEQIAKIVDGQIEGNKDIVIKKLQRIEDAGEGDLTFLARMEYEKYLVASSASAVIVPNNYKNSPKENQAFITINPTSQYSELATTLSHHTKLQFQDFIKLLLSVLFYH
ncbi:MAG: LpxD N-terminal domain-containing protein [Bacteroidales bacterium]